VPAVNLGEAGRRHSLAGNHRQGTAVQRGELGIGKLEAGGIDIGDVVADRVNIALRGIDA